MRRPIGAINDQDSEALEELVDRDVEALKERVPVFSVKRGHDRRTRRRMSVPADRLRPPRFDQRGGYHNGRTTADRRLPISPSLDTEGALGELG